MICPGRLPKIVVGSKEVMSGTGFPLMILKIPPSADPPPGGALFTPM